MSDKDMLLKYIDWAFGLAEKYFDATASKNVVWPAEVSFDQRAWILSASAELKGLKHDDLAKQDVTLGKHVASGVHMICREVVDQYMSG
jgi:hypothetical protein